MKIKKFKGKEIKIEELSKKHFKEVNELKKNINSLIDENAKIILNQKVNTKEEKEWLKGKIKSIKNNKEVHLVAYDGKKIIAGCEVKLDRGKSSHVGNFGISIVSGYRRLGLGTYLSKEVMRLAKKKLKPKPKIVRISVFSNNEPAIGLYKKIDCKEVARIPKMIEHNKKLIDEIVLIKEI